MKGKNRDKKGGREAQGTEQLDSGCADCLPPFAPVSFSAVN
jgi:hypothetical protein